VNKGMKDELESMAAMLKITTELDRRIWQLTVDSGKGMISTQEAQQYWALEHEAIRILQDLTVAPK